MPQSPKGCADTVVQFVHVLKMELKNQPTMPVSSQELKD